MKRITLWAALSALLLYCCASDPQAAVRQRCYDVGIKYVTSKTNSDTLRIDSFTLVKVDTFNDKELLAVRGLHLFNQLDALKTKCELAGQIASLSKRELELHASMFGPNDAVTNATRAEYKRYLEEQGRVLDKMRGIAVQVDSIQKLLDSGVVDSTTMRGYRPWYRFRLIGSDGAIKHRIEKYSLFLDPSFAVIEK